MYSSTSVALSLTDSGLHITHHGPQAHVEESYARYKTLDKDTHVFEVHRMIQVRGSSVEHWTPQSKARGKTYLIC
jgi:hypothetical protein